MVELPGGTFRMGSPEEDELALDSEKPQHTVTVSGFAMSRCVVTRQLYREVVGAGPSEWQSAPDDAQLPANYLDWFEAVELCNRLSTRQGYRPCYKRQGNTVLWDREADGYRLPTEAEWEYAARAGTTTRWGCGDAPTDLGRHAWYAVNAGGGVHPVGTKAPNPWGFFDMAGNVYEWCWDRYGPYPAEAVADPAGPADGAVHVLRGGAYWGGARVLRSAHRRRDEPEFRRDDVGVRVVRRPRRQP
jgi:formylglycine-generating enzyme required for sulfatase activity